MEKNGNHRTYDFLVMFLDYVQLKLYAAWKVSKHGVFSGPYFPAFGDLLRKSRYSVRIQEYTVQKKQISIFSPNTRKYGLEKSSVF